MFRIFRREVGDGARREIDSGRVTGPGAYMTFRHSPDFTGPLLKRIEDGEIDPSFVVRHVRPLEEGPDLYRTFRDKEDGCIKASSNPDSHLLGGR